MAQNQNTTEPNTDRTPATLSPDASEYLAHYLPDKNAEPYPLAQITQELGLNGPRIPARELLDKPFIILGAKTFGSSFDPERHAYFCVIRFPDQDAVYTTVLGGFAVTDMLDAVVASGFARPLLVTMREVQGGKFGHYYVLE